MASRARAARSVPSGAASTREAVADHGDVRGRRQLGEQDAIGRVGDDRRDVAIGGGDLDDEHEVGGDRLLRDGVERVGRGQLAAGDVEVERAGRADVDELAFEREDGEPDTEVGAGELGVVDDRVGVVGAGDRAARGE